MGDTARALRERVARAIEATIRHAVEPDVRANQMIPDELAMLASSAIDLVLEEAEKAIKETKTKSRAIAAIRALKSGK